VAQMPLYAIDDRVPTIAPDAFVHPDAVIIGHVTIGSRSTVWPGAVLRGDYGAIEVGTATSIQDGSVVHATSELDTIIGSEVVIGHLVHLEGCVVEDGALVGSGSVVLHRARVGARATVGAGAVITNNMQVPPGALAVGTPAIIKEGRSNPELIKMAVAVYLENGERYRRGLRRLD
jgi:carbonic anhydrase/acetyltransferase-like protein (isoleucine patch superfamily)